jgi:hypothetical protein
MGETSMHDADCRFYLMERLRSVEITKGFYGLAE